MDINYALIALSALSQETRLRIFRLLITYGSDGLSAGELGKALERGADARLPGKAKAMGFTDAGWLAQR